MFHLFYGKPHKHIGIVPHSSIRCIYRCLCPAYAQLLCSSCSTVTMEHTSPHRVSVNIGETVKKHLAIVPNSFAAHPLIGCDKVGAYFGIGKVKAVKVLHQVSIPHYLQYRFGHGGNH